MNFFSYMLAILPVSYTHLQVIVIRRADETDDAQLHHELVDDFLNFLFRDEPLFLSLIHI